MEQHLPIKGQKAFISDRPMDEPFPTRLKTYWKYGRCCSNWRLFWDRRSGETTLNSTFVSNKLIQNLYLLPSCTVVISRVSCFAPLSHWCTVCIWFVFKKKTQFRYFIKLKILLECSYGNQIHASQSAKSYSNLLIG